VIGPHQSVYRGVVRALDDWEQVALNAFPGHIGPTDVLSAAGLDVHLVDDNDARLLHPLERVALDLVHVNELLALFLRDNPSSLRDLHPTLFAPSASHVAEKILQVDAHLLEAHGAEHLQHRRAVGRYLDFYLA